MNLVSAWIAAAAAAFLAITAPTALAAAPTILDPVAPGVPGDGRAWELVTPGEVVPARPVAGYRADAVAGISRNGDRIVYRSAGTLPDAPFGGLTVSNLAVRGADGWTSSSLVAPAPANATVFGIDGPLAFDPDLRSSIWTNFLPAPDSYGIYASDLDGTYTELIKVGSGGLLGASTDLARLVFVSERHLLPADASRAQGASLYQLEGSTLRLVDVEDDGSLVSACGTSNPRISIDARRVLFAASPVCGSNQHVYLWEDGHTIDVSASQCTLPDCGPERSADPSGMTPSGSDAFFESGQRLTDEDSNEAPDLYRYNVASGTLTLLTRRDPCCITGGTNAPVRAVDGTRAYFTADSGLRAGDPTVRSLYLFDDSGLHLIGPSENDFVISHDGRYAFVATTARLAAGDSDEAKDVYRYDAVSGDAVQISIGPEGRGNGPLDAALPFLVGGAERTTPVEAGAIVFETAEQLLPGDHNEDPDLYLWREGAGIALISSGSPGFRAWYYGATPDLRSIYFGTHATLLPRDRDGGERDAYVARVGGGFSEPVAGECESGACGTAASDPAHRRPPLASAGGGPRLGLARIDRAARRQLAAAGWTTLLAEVPAAGRVTAEGRARIGSRRSLVASGSAEAKQAGPVRLRLVLTPVARRRLAQGRELRVGLVLRLADASWRTGFVLRLRY